MAVRWTKLVAEGLACIYANSSCELEAHQMSEMECTCPGCMPEGGYDLEEGEPPCQCEGKQLTRQCKGCQTTAAWAAALSWMSYQMRKHATPTKD